MGIKSCLVSVRRGISLYGITVMVSIRSIFGQSTSGKSVNEIRNIDKGLSDGLECIG